MAKNPVQLGDILSLDPGATKSSGDLGSFVGVMLADGVSGTLAPVARKGVFNVLKTTGTEWTVGQTIYFKASTSAGITLADGNNIVGKCMEDAASGAAVGRVELAGPSATQAGSSVILQGQGATAAAATAVIAVGAAYNGKVARSTQLATNTAAVFIVSSIVAAGNLTVTFSGSTTAKFIYEILDADVA